LRAFFAPLAVALVALSAVPAEADDCKGSPASAVVTLPAPLDRWATIVCTPYGHIISNRQGWIWSRPSGYSPIFIPAQMVQSEPKPLGNDAYFTAITVTKSAGSDFESAYAAYSTGFAPDAKKPDGYRLDVTSVLGTKLTLFFFDYGDHAWGIWCGMDRFKCELDSRFMLLDMAHKPGGG
jgi:hypothetical protein